ncbi:hypothetical protein EDD15DRAFT_2469757 [Pisolithus albus]|nr:hypothetical protein EDD15DRAFT_2469757 [Pisolithus albus]
MRKEMAERERKTRMRVVLGTRDWTTTGVIGDGEGEGNGFVYNNERVVRKTIAGEDTCTANSAVAAAPRAYPAETKAKLDRLRVIIQVKCGDDNNKSKTTHVTSMCVGQSSPKESELTALPRRTMSYAAWMFPEPMHGSGAEAEMRKGATLQLDGGVLSTVAEPNCTVDANINKHQFLGAAHFISLGDSFISIWKMYLMLCSAMEAIASEEALTYLEWRVTAIPASLTTAKSLGATTGCDQKYPPGGSSQMVKEHPVQIGNLVGKTPREDIS